MCQQGVYFWRLWGRICSIPLSYLLVVSGFPWCLESLFWALPSSSHGCSPYVWVYLQIFPLAYQSYYIRAHPVDIKILSPNKINMRFQVLDFNIKFVEGHKFNSSKSLLVFTTILYNSVELWSTLHTIDYSAVSKL